MRKFDFQSFHLPAFFLIFINNFLNFSNINGMNNNKNDSDDNFLNKALFRGMETMKEWHQQRQPCHENFAKIPAHLDGDGRWKWEQHSISIQIDGGVQKQFVFREFAPDLFCHLRSISHIDHRQYFASLTGKPLSTWITPTGSGSKFWITGDHHFMLKSLLTSLDEQNFLKDQLAEHAKYLASVQARSFIPRFVGLYSIEDPSSADEPIWIVAMQNILWPTTNASNSNNAAGGRSQALHLDYRFDLKCCSYGRRVPPEEWTKAEPTFQDWEFNGRDNEDGLFPNGIVLDEESYKLVAEIIEKDTKFLARIGVLDYSLLIGIHFNNNGGNFDEQNDIRQTHIHKAIGQPGAIIQASCFGCKLPKNIADKQPKNKNVKQSISILVGFVDIILRWNWRFQAKVTKRCYVNKECKEFEQALVNSENYAFRLKCVANRDVFRVQEERKMKKFAEKYCEDYNKIDWENKQ